MSDCERTFTGIQSNGPIEALPSTQYSNSLYHFARDSYWILKALSDGYFIANYNEEQIGYLNVEPLSSIWVSMVCFCDIPLSRERIAPHLETYGSFGIGLSKEWALRQGVNPVHYIVPSSQFAKDFQEAWRAASGSGRLGEKAVGTLADHLVTQLAYFKPVQDGNRCFEDECEWRFVPAGLEGWESVRPLMKEGELDLLRGAQLREECIRLHFDYADITHLLVPDRPGVAKLIGAVNELSADSAVKDMLKTKIRIVGDKSAW